jgi:hypothetical protein
MSPAFRLAGQPRGPQAPPPDVDLLEPPSDLRRENNIIAYCRAQDHASTNPQIKREIKILRLRREKWNLAVGVDPPKLGGSDPWRLRGVGVTEPTKL